VVEVPAQLAGGGADAGDREFLGGRAGGSTGEHGVLRRADHERRHEARGVDGAQRERAARDVRGARGGRGHVHRQPFARGERRRARKNARRMAVGTDAEQHEVETVVALLAPAERLAQLALVALAGARGHRDHRMHLLGRNVGVVDDHLLDAPEVRALVLEAHAALVDHPEVRAPPGNRPVARVVHQLLVERHRRLPAGEREVEVAELAHAVEGVRGEVRGQLVEQLVHARARDHLAAEPRRLDRRVESLDPDLVVGAVRIHGDEC
jgi:hypothetical protein